MDRKRYSKPELLAPAGDILRLKTAVDYGADAVYLGGKQYSLRSRASNFSMEDIREACAYAKDHGVRVHVTVNEIPHDRDLEGLPDYLYALQEAGVTAIIAASPYIMKLCRKAAPKLEVHASTQCSLMNSAAAKLLVRTAGADRIVLARECTLQEIRKIKEACGTEVEVFIHGGMCANYSGRCTLSNRMTLRDANRGGCAQSCRWNYQLKAGETEYDETDEAFTLGSKDLAGFAYLPELMEIGVASLKIEGRMKTEYYVASVVSALRHLIDEIYEAQAPLSAERMEYHRREVRAAQNREVWNGFFENPQGNDSLIYHANSDADVSHAFLGTAIAWRDGILELETRNPIVLKDRIEVLEPGKENRVFVCDSMMDEFGEPMTRSKVPVRHIFIPVEFPVAAGALLRKAVV